MIRQRKIRALSRGDQSGSRAESTTFDTKSAPDPVQAFYRPTAMVLLALRKVPTDNRQKRDECFQRGLKWMLTFQCKDGGWASFDKDCTKGVLEKVPFADHNAMLDPECADITARILELLGYEGYACACAYDGRAGLRLLEVHRPDLVIVYDTQTDLKQQFARAGIAMFAYVHRDLADVTTTMRALGRRV